LAHAVSVRHAGYERHLHADQSHRLDIRLQIRKTEEDHEATVAVNSPDNGITITNAAGGAFTVLLDRPRLVRLAPGDYVFDMVRLLASGLQERICEGTATVVEGTTR